MAHALTEGSHQAQQDGRRGSRAVFDDDLNGRDARHLLLASDVSGHEMSAAHHNVVIASVNSKAPFPHYVRKRS
jgi:hypothetical protein